jgi:hypothetical protein
VAESNSGSWVIFPNEANDLFKLFDCLRSEDIFQPIHGFSRGRVRGECLRLLLKSARDRGGFIHPLFCSVSSYVLGYFDELRLPANLALRVTLNVTLPLPLKAVFIDMRITLSDKHRQL